MSNALPLSIGSALLLIAACGPSTPPADNAAPTASASAHESSTPETKPAPSAPPSATASVPVDTGSFANGPTVQLNGAKLRLNYQGGSYDLSESAIVATPKATTLRFTQPAAEGTHVLAFTTAPPKVGEAAKVSGLSFHVTPAKTTDGKFTDRDISSLCSASGAVTYAELPKGASGGKGSIDVTVTCKDFSELREPLEIKGDFAGVPQKAK